MNATYKEVTVTYLTRKIYSNNDNATHAFDVWYGKQGKPGLRFDSPARAAATILASENGDREKTTARIAAQRDYDPDETDAVLFWQAALNELRNLSDFRVLEEIPADEYYADAD